MSVTTCGQIDGLNPSFDSGFNFFFFAELHQRQLQN